MAEDDRPMPERPADAPSRGSPSRGPVISGEQARQGRVVLNTPVRRWIFVAGLVVLVIAAILFGR